ncbi:MAG: hypothetical protein AB4041_18940 [Microcystaceae cyanobacterium]
MLATSQPVRSITVPQPVKGLYQYCAVLCLKNGDDTFLYEDNGYIADEIETVFPCFDHVPTSSELNEWFQGWLKAGYELISLNKVDPTLDEF